MARKKMLVGLRIMKRVQEAYLCEYSAWISPVSGPNSSIEVKLLLNLASPLNWNLRKR